MFHHNCCHGIAEAEAKNGHIPRRHLKFSRTSMEKTAANIRAPFLGWKVQKFILIIVQMHCVHSEPVTRPACSGNWCVSPELGETKGLCWPPWKIDRISPVPSQATGCKYYAACGGPGLGTPYIRMVPYVCATARAIDQEACPHSLDNAPGQLPRHTVPLDHVAYLRTRISAVWI